MLSVHFHEAQQWEKAWRYARRAAERAAEVYANVEAAAALERAIESGRRCAGSGVTHSPRPTKQLGDVRFRLGEFDRAAAVAFRASKRLLDPRLAPHSRAVAEGGADPDAFRQLPADAAPPLARAARARAVRGRVPPPAGRALRALRRRAFPSEPERGGDRWSCAPSARPARTRPDALAYAYMINDMALLAEGAPEAATHGPGALAIYERLGDLVWQAATLNNMGLLAYELGRWSESLALYERAGTIWESTGDRWSATFAKYNRGEILSDQGRFDQAEEQLRERSVYGVLPAPRPRSLRRHGSWAASRPVAATSTTAERLSSRPVTSRSRNA